MCVFNCVKTHVCPLSSLCSSLLPPSIFPTPLRSAFSIQLSSLTSTQGESAGWSQERCAKRDMQFKTLSWCAFPQHILTPFPFQTSLFPLHFSWSVNLLLLHDFQTFTRAPVNEGDSPHRLIIPIPPLCFVSLGASLSRLHFFCPLFLEAHFCIAPSHPFIAHAAKSDRPDKCGSVVTQISRATERAKINHFTPSLSSAIFFLSVFVALPSSINLPALLFRILLLLVIFWIPFNTSFPFQYVPFSLLTLQKKF